MLLALKEEGGREARNVGNPYKLEEETDSSPEPPEGMQPFHHLNFSLVRPVSDF